MRRVRRAIAGVIGGHESQVTAETTDLFLEVATFDPIGVRRTRRALGVTTDASHRFERLVPPSLPLETYAIAVRLLMAVAGGKVDGSAVLVGQASPPTAPIRLRSRRVAVLLGIAGAGRRVRRLAPYGRLCRHGGGGRPLRNAAILAYRCARRDRPCRGGRATARLRDVSR